MDEPRFRLLLTPHRLRHNALQGEYAITLNQWFHTNKGAPVNKWTHYLPIYERYFAPFVNRRINFLEIGTGQGGSSRMWKQYFGPAAQIVTVDIREECKQFEDDQIAVRIGDQADTVFLKALHEEFGPFDIVLDDGVHTMSAVGATFAFLYLRMARDAVYVVEDLHTSYLDGWGGGLRRDGTFFERVKGLIDEMHAHYTNGQLPESEFAQVTRGIHVHDSIVVFEKGQYITRRPESIPFVEGSTVW